ncbi:MAG TPA: hypothetical protein VK176_07925 [Phycisphaerales bacterium]|nr:hypothetical protein [Phycisphaerales bacterium]
MHHLDLSTLRWTLHLESPGDDAPPDLRPRLKVGIPATIPGCVHEALLTAGLLPDPRFGIHEPMSTWVSRSDWTYRTSFDASPFLEDESLTSGAVVTLHFDSLDTIADITLNGDHAAHSQSEFIPAHVDISRRIRPGLNTLSITLRSPLRYIEEEARRLGPRPVNGDWAPFNMIRKCASSFEWDWGPRLASSGISAGHVTILFAAHKVTDPVALPAPPVAALRADPITGEFCFIDPDGTPIFAMGANWIPNGLFPSDRTPQKVRPLLEAARDCGMNMIRVWGGGRYEPDWFYELCAELGLMVWQDFMFACACYPEEEPLRSLIIDEARAQTTRLARHPAIVLWCGGNENHWAYQSWGFKEKLDKLDQPGKTWGRTYWQSLLPAIVREHDPSRPYWPDSPWSFEESTHPNDASRGDRHSWDVPFWDHWSGGYQKIIPRFCSEFGQQSPSNHATLKEAGLLPADGESLASSDTSWSSSLMGRALAQRQRGPGGNQRWYDEPLDALFHRPTDFDQWHFAAQLLQARALRTAIEWHRACAPICRGSLLWQLNDAWPGLSWSIIDSAGRRKPACHAVKAAHAPRIATLHVVDGSLTLFAVNDTDEPWREHASLRLISFTGDTVRRWPCTLEVPPRSSLRVGRLGKPKELATDPARQLISFRSMHASAEWFFLPDKHLEYPQNPIRKLRITPIEGGVRLYLRAESLLRDLIILTDRLDPCDRIGCGHTTLLPTERFSITLRAPSLIHDLKASGLAEDQPHTWPFIRCANTLGGS